MKLDTPLMLELKTFSSSYRVQISLKLSHWCITCAMEYSMAVQKSKKLPRIHEADSRTYNSWVCYPLHIMGRVGKLDQEDVQPAFALPD